MQSSKADAVEDAGGVYAWRLTVRLLWWLIAFLNFSTGWRSDDAVGFYFSLLVAALAVMCGWIAEPFAFPWAQRRKVQR